MKLGEDVEEAHRAFRRMQKKLSESQKRRHALRKLLAPLYQMEDTQ